MDHRGLRRTGQDGAGTVADLGGIVNGPVGEECAERPGCAGALRETRA
jgi:hypothetical protein